MVYLATDTGFRCLCPRGRHNTICQRIGTRLSLPFIKTAAVVMRVKYEILPDNIREQPHRGCRRDRLIWGWSYPSFLRYGRRDLSKEVPKPPMHNNSPEAMPALTHAPDADVRGREKLEGGQRFVMHTDFAPAGDQPTAIAELSSGILSGERDQVLLGATGTGKTFTMAKIIEDTQRPAIVLAPNKTLAAQLYGRIQRLLPR